MNINDGADEAIKMKLLGCVSYLDDGNNYENLLKKIKILGQAVYFLPCIHSSLIMNLLYKITAIDNEEKFNEQYDIIKNIIKNEQYDQDFPTTIRLNNLTSEIKKVDEI